MIQTRRKRYSSTVKHVGLLLGFLFVTRSLAANTVRVYVNFEGLESFSDTGRAVTSDIIVIDPVTQKVVQTIKGIATPHGITLSPDRKWLYITSESEKVVAIVDQKTGEIIKKVSLSGRPHTLVTTKDGSKSFVDIYEAPGALDIIDSNSREKVRSIPINGPVYDSSLTPDGKYLVANTHKLGDIFKLFVIDVQTERPMWEVGFKSVTNNMAIEAKPDGSTSRIFLTRHGLRGFDVVDFGERNIISEIKLPETEASRGSTTGPATKEEVERMVGKNVTQDHGIGITPDNKTFWIDNELDHAVYVYSLPDVKLLGHVPVGARPNWMAISPDSKQVFVLNTGDSTMSIIDAKTLKEVARMPIEHQPGQRLFKVDVFELP
jgi:YVTN family beta-propeller protein